MTIKSPTRWLINFFCHWDEEAASAKFSELMAKEIIRRAMR